MKSLDTGAMCDYINSDSTTGDWSHIALNKRRSCLPSPVGYRSGAFSL